LLNTVDSAFCLGALEAAVQRQAAPAILNIDSGCQFTSEVFTARLQAADVAISMNGRGWIFDYILVGRLWRSIHYEYIYLHDSFEVLALLESLITYFEYFNSCRSNRGLTETKRVEAYRVASTGRPATIGALVDLWRPVTCPT